MESVVETFADASVRAGAAVAAAPVGGPSALELAALCQAALVRNGGGWLPVAPRLWLEWAVQAAREALEFTLDRPVEVEVMGADPGNPREAVFAVEFEHPAITGNGMLSFDLPAARVIVDAMESDFANVRGAGSLSEAELGVLEYAALATVDRAVRAAPAAEGFVLKAFHDARGGRAALEQGDCGGGGRTIVPALALRVRVAGREGIARLHVRGWAPEALSTSAAPPPAARAKSGAVAGIEVRVALPAVRVERKDLQSLQIGDVLLIGATDLTSFGANCRLATAGGWELSAATIVRDSPTVVSVRAGRFALQTLPAAAAGEEQVILNLLVGSRSLSPEQVQRWPAEALIDLPKDPALPVEVYEGMDRVARGELVRLDGEIGVRLAEVRRA